MSARVLIVEDDPASLELARYLLTASGHTVLTATDGEQGLALARSERPDAILCDLQMPVISGYEVAAALRDDATLLIAISASTMRRDQESAIAAGFDGFIAKPIDPERFVSQIQAFLAARRQATASRGQERH